MIFLVAALMFGTVAIVKNEPHIHVQCWSKYGLVYDREVDGPVYRNGNKLAFVEKESGRPMQANGNCVVREK
jgi:hypothetical protein